MLRIPKIFKGSYFRLMIKLGLDLVVFAAALPIACFLSHLSNEQMSCSANLPWIIALFVGVRLIIFTMFRVYSHVWRYSSLDDMNNLVIATGLGSLILFGASLFWDQMNLPIQVLTMEMLLVIVLVGGVRVTVRRIYERFFEHQKKSNKIRNVLIYGAGRAGELLFRNIGAARDQGVKVVGFIDDDPFKHGRRIHGATVLGGGNRIREIIEEHNATEVYFAISAISGLETRRLMQLIHEQVGTDIEVQMIPGLRDLIDGRVTVNQLRRVDIKDLLRRPPVELDDKPVRAMVRGKRVMVVGAGGSIGSEICAQIGGFHPTELMMVDVSEFSIYQLDEAMSAKYPNLPMRQVVMDATNETMMREIFAEFNPEIVFHAAAYKHVPLMENYPRSAVYNNLESTRVLAHLADEFEVERFVMISSDKAVRPFNVMGATKRIGELILLHHARRSETKFMAVRFGNVLGSSGSVIPKFRKQIESGGPVTVTHPEITRYFMLIPEAVELVLQAAAIGENGMIYVLDMGDPVRIVDLARYMIRFAGLREGVDIKIDFTGLRPGEKMYESLLLEGEEMDTQIKGIFKIRPDWDESDEFSERLDSLILTCHMMNNDEIKKELHYFVPEYVHDSSNSSKPVSEKRVEAGKKSSDIPSLA